ncbi:winged helix DNA-binding domain-containing protein [Paenibacillus sp. YPG26]|uniref:winged helix DNA-binding domain-containing protein n=1 Tax=Paenibacillus sp. YPG26 TaxID=2878915 RepID=UPI00203EAEC8|nr:winged helix DNA-binding domain-containing protein [Paenibacillus sp. YPG26]USB33648.1 winged helix DNA-binding domain-containing protein [Paenibacillus sp. YPG26]
MSSDNTAPEAISGKEELPVLSTRALNRALLARQMLLCREELPSLEAIERLAGLQAQSPSAPYFALWARLETFNPEELSHLLQEKKAVRIALMRSTIHLVSAGDCLSFRPNLQPVLDRSLQGAFGKALTGLNLNELASRGRDLVEETPLTAQQLGQSLQVIYPGYEPSALSAAVRNSVPLVQLPPRGLWGKSGQAVHTSAEKWLGQPLSPVSSADQMVVRYLAAFGPASVKDIQVWSGLTRLSEAVERLRPQLITFRDEHGSELFDLPGAPRPDPSTPAPPRFLGEFDNMLLSYADRTRIIDKNIQPRVCTKNGLVRPTLLLGGFVCGTWTLKRERGRAVLLIEPFKPLTIQEKEALTEEGARLLHFAAASAKSHDIRFEDI